MFIRVYFLKKERNREEVLTFKNLNELWQKQKSAQQESSISKAP